MPPPGTAPRAGPAQRDEQGVLTLAYVALLGVGGVAIAFALRDVEPTGAAAGPVEAAALCAVIVTAFLLAVHFRTRAGNETVNHVEAVIAPLLWAFSPPVAVLVGAVAPCVTGVIRRSPPVRVGFNVAQWALAIGVGSAVVTAVDSGHGLTARNLAALALGLLATGVASSIAFAGVMLVVSGGRPRIAPSGLSAREIFGWPNGVGPNVLLGLLFVLAFEGSPWSIALFPVPLVVLHLAHRGHAVAQADRQRLAGLHRAAQSLAAPLDPREAVASFLGEVAGSFSSGAAVLVLRRDDGGHDVHQVSAAARGHAYTTSTEHGGSGLAGVLATARGGPMRLAAGDAPVLAAAGYRDAVVAPLAEGGRVVGALAILDTEGLSGLPSAELDVLDALAREAAGAFSKGRLLARVLEERKRFEDIVRSTSDGILTLDRSGVVQSWNPALEALTGLRAGDVVGVAGALDRLDLRTPEGRAVTLDDWTQDPAWPDELRVTTAGGERRIVCTYSPVLGVDGHPHTLVVVARDVTPAQEAAELRAQFRRLVEAEAAQRVVVEHLQQAVMPTRPTVPGADIGLHYVASDPSSPTGGDLYDCQLMPNGELHLAVVDVLGHGVAATQDALSVVHTIRTVVFEGTPLEQVVGRVDELIGKQNPELVATVVLARYDPRTARLRVASGGHPPALVVSPDGAARHVEAEGGAVGWPGAGSDGVAETVLAPGETLVLYTDGLVEARKDIVEGLEALADHARAVAPLPAQELAQALVEKALAGADRRDDTLALVLRRQPVPVRRDRAVWHLTASGAQASLTRRAATGWLRARGLPSDDAALVMAELLANAVVVARSRVELELAVDPTSITVQVADDGSGFEVVPASRADDDSEHGRGLQIVRTLADVEVRTGRDGSTVRARIALDPFFDV